MNLIRIFKNQIKIAGVYYDKKATINECLTLAKMAIQMWDSHTVDELAMEFEGTKSSPVGYLE